MALSWTGNQGFDGRDAYLDWSALLRRRRDALPPARPDDGNYYEPIFVRLTSAQARADLLALVGDPLSPLIMDAHEHAELSARASGADPLPSLADEYALYRRVGTGDDAHATVFETLDVGVPVVISDGATALNAAPVTAPSASPGAPIVAVIDDGIGFLNARFRRTPEDGPQESRFHALWIQALEQRGAGGHVAIGEVLSKAQITAMFDEIEADAYSAVNARNFGLEARQTTGFGTSHGTHVLDLAAGADPDDPTQEARDWPLLAVQLPPQAIEDTSGTRFESYMVQAMRWILRRAREVDESAPVIVNLSLGMLAGPKDGSRFVEYQIAREAAEWERVTGQVVRVVWSFGNNHDSALVARQNYRATTNRSGTDKKVDWRIQPCDQTPNFMEIRVPREDIGALGLAVKAPGTGWSDFTPLSPGELRTLEENGAAIARIYHVPARDFGETTSPAHYVVATAPTEGRKTGEPEAPSGLWQVKVRHEGPEAREVILQIQRDDELRGYGAQARQSYFDDPKAYGWSERDQDYSLLASGCDITHDGSHSALASSTARQIFTVGAAAPNDAEAPAGLPGYSPARYTGKGADWSVEGPTVATPTDEGSFHRGRLASGTLSGSARLLGGTSASAALLARALGVSASRIKSRAGAGGQTSDLDPTKLGLQAVAAKDAARLGSYVVTPPQSHPDRVENRSAPAALTS